MGTWNDLIPTLDTGNLEYTFPQSPQCSIRVFTQLTDTDYNGLKVIDLVGGVTITLEGLNGGFRLMEGATVLIADIPIVRNVWHDVVFTIDGALVSFYLDGILILESVISIPLNFTIITLYGNGAQLYDELIFVEHAVTKAKVEYWARQTEQPASADPGLSVAEIQIYQRADSLPATPTGGSYDFATGILTPPTGWSKSIPPGSLPVWASITSAAVIGQTNVDSILVWSSPVKTLENGASLNAIYQRALTQPATPTGGLTIPVGWYDSVVLIPPSPGAVIWSSIGSRANEEAEWVWQLPIQLEGDEGEQGPAGTPGYLGLQAYSDELVLKGFDAAGDLIAEEGYIYVNGMRYVVPAYSLVLTGTGQGYIVYDPSWLDKVRCVTMNPSGTSMVYNDYNTDGVIPVTSTTFVIGQFIRDTVIHNQEIIEAQTLATFARNSFLQIMESNTMTLEEATAWSAALGTNSFFQRFAAVEAFIDSVKARQVEVIDGTYKLDINKTDGVKQVVDSTPTFHAKPSGDVMLGNYDPVTNTGGIYYDKEQDKLLGNVAYDQWDLVIESDSDLAKLYTGAGGYYSKVLVTIGTYTATEKIDLEEHRVEIFQGLGTRSRIKIGYDLTGWAFSLGYYTTLIKGLHIFTSVTQTGGSGFFYTSYSGKVFENLRLVGGRYGTGIKIFNSTYARSTYFYNVTVEAMEIGFYICHNMVVCKAENNEIGYKYCHYGSSLLAYNNTNIGFSNCESLSSCSAFENGIGFYKCFGLGACQSVGNTTDYDTCLQDTDFKANMIHAVNELKLQEQNLYKIQDAGLTHLPNGLIMQWRKINVTASNIFALGFPMAFPTLCAHASFSGSGWCACLIVDKTKANVSSNVNGYHTLFAIGW